MKAWLWMYYSISSNRSFQTPPNSPTHWNFKEAERADSGNVYFTNLWFKWKKKPWLSRCGLNFKRNCTLFTSCPCTIKGNRSSEVPLECPRNQNNCSHFIWPSFQECTQYRVSGWMYITDVRSLFSPMLECETCSSLFEPAWLAAFKDSTHEAVYETQSVLHCLQSLWTEVFLYIISQHIQAVSTWADRFGPNDMAWQQNNPKGTWGGFLEPGPNYNTAQKNQTAPALNWLLFFHAPIDGHSIMRWRQTKPLLLDPKHSSNCHCMVSYSCSWTIL